MRLVVAVLATLLAVTGCAASSGDRSASPALADLAEPLVDAHDALARHADDAAQDLHAAHEQWPHVEARVTAAVESVPPLEGTALPARERSTLVGYKRGLEVAAGAWSDAHAAVEQGDEESAARAAGRARDRMAHLERLRAGVTP